MSPRIRSVATPSVTGFSSDDEMNVRAYTNSCMVSVKAKMTTVRIAGTESGSTVFTNAPMMVQPSTIAASSISRGTDLKNPMNSQVQNGIVKVGYTRTRDHSESCSPSTETTRDSGRNSRVGGTR